MQSPVLSSTFFLTLLMMIGLVFFIRASTKERIEVVQFAIAQPLDDALDKLQTYFLQRSYQAIDQDSDQDSDHTHPASTMQTRIQCTTKRVFEGRVRPSIFLAILLFVLATVGCLCLALVLSILLPQWGAFVWFLVVLAPAASLFYWKKSSRVEQVSFKVEPLASPSSLGPAKSGLESQGQPETKVTVMGHRDELASLQQALIQQSLSIRTLELDFG